MRVRVAIAAAVLCALGTGAAAAWQSSVIPGDVTAQAAAIGALPGEHGNASGAPAATTIPSDLAARVAAAPNVASDLRVGVSVIDLDTGAQYDGGDATGEFGSASVVKVLIAARLLVEGRMSGETEQMALDMIERSNDDAANVLWGVAGADDLEPWVEHHWGIHDLGSPNGIPGRWGNTHLTAHGMAALYAALRADPVVWPWLSNALHQVEPIAADGTNQTFGLLGIDPTGAVKQGWANGSADDPDDAIINSTGLVDDDHLIVVILSEGHHNNGSTDDRGFNADEAQQVTKIAASLLT